MRLCYHLALVATILFPETMPLSAAPVSRIHEHTRSLRFEGHVRADGLRDIDALCYPRWRRAAKTGTD